MPSGANVNQRQSCSSLEKGKGLMAGAASNHKIPRRVNDKLPPVNHIL